MINYLISKTNKFDQSEIWEEKNGLFFLHKINALEMEENIKDADRETSIEKKDVYKIIKHSSTISRESVINRIHYNEFLWLLFLQIPPPQHHFLQPSPKVHKINNFSSINFSLSFRQLPQNLPSIFNHSFLNNSPLTKVQL